VVRTLNVSTAVLIVHDFLLDRQPVQPAKQRLGVGSSW